MWRGIGIGIAIGAWSIAVAACGGGSTSDEDTAVDTSDASAADDGDDGSADDSPTGGGDGDGADDGADDDGADDAVDDTAGDTAADDGAGDGPGCPGVSLLDNPEDPALPGPWPVGARTVQVGGLTAEVWYPARPGRESGQEPAVYDVRLALPKSEQDKIADADNPWQPCDCYRDLPVDDRHGPYPVVFFIHGTAGFRTQSLPQMTHWASRGFVVIAADHPGLWMADTLGSLCGQGMVAQDLTGDVGILMAAARGEASGLEDLAPYVDPERFAVAGHSAGGNATAQFSDEASVLVPMAAGGVQPGTAVVSTLVLGAQEDSVVAYSQQVDGYEQSPAPKRLVGIANQGHLAFSGLCSLRNDAGEDLLEIATANGVCGANFAGFLFQCSDAFLPDPDTWQIVNFATSAVLEETLHCSEIGAVLLEIQDRYPAVAEFRHDP